LPCSVPNGTEHGIFLRHGNGSKYCACTLEFDTVECNECVYLIFQRLPFFICYYAHIRQLSRLFKCRCKKFPRLGKIQYTAVTMHDVKSYFDTVFSNYRDTCTQMNLQSCFPKTMKEKVYTYIY